MSSVWQQMMLAALPLHHWREGSWLYRLVGALRSWRQGSLLMPWAEPIGAAMVSVLFAIAPFTSTEIIGWLLAMCGLYWLLLTLADDSVAAPIASESIANELTVTRLGLTPIHLAVAMFWAAAAVSAAMSPLKKLAIVGLGKMSLYLVFFLLVARVLRSSKLRSLVITVFLHVALWVSGYGLRQQFFGADALATWVDPTSPTANSVRVYSYLGNPNLLAGYVIPAIAFSLMAIFAWRRPWAKALAIVMTVVNTSCLILTQSRGGWIGLAVMSVVIVLLLRYWWGPYMPKFWRYSALPILLAGLVGVLALGFAFVPPFRYRILSIFAGSGDSSNAFRMNVWAAAIQMIQDFPVFGIGPGDQVFKQVYPKYQRPRFSALSAYSILLETTVELGFIGLAAFLYLLLVTFNQGFVQLRRLRGLGDRDGFWLMASVAMMAGMLGHGVVDTVWYRPSLHIIWWLGIGLVASFYMYQQPLAASEEQDDSAAIV